MYETTSKIANFYFIDLLILSQYQLVVLDFLESVSNFFLSEASSLIIVMYTYITFLQFKNNWDLRLWGKFENVLAIDRMFVSLQHSCLDSGSPIAVGNFFSCHLSNVHIGIIVILLFPQAQ